MRVLLYGVSFSYLLVFLPFCISYPRSVANNISTPQVILEPRILCSVITSFILNPSSLPPTSRPPLSLHRTRTRTTTTSTHQLPLLIFRINTSHTAPNTTSLPPAASIRRPTMSPTPPRDLSILLDNRLRHLPQHPRLTRYQHQHE